MKMFIMDITVINKTIILELSKREVLITYSSPYNSSSALDKVLISLDISYHDIVTNRPKKARETYEPQNSPPIKAYKNQEKMNNQYTTKFLEKLTEQ